MITVTTFKVDRDDTHLSILASDTHSTYYVPVKRNRAAFFTASSFKLSILGDILVVIISWQVLRSFLAAV